MQDDASMGAIEEEENTSDNTADTNEEKEAIKQCDSVKVPLLAADAENILAT